MRQPATALPSALLAGLLAATGACGASESPTVGKTGPEVSVAVAALTLPGITEALYNLRVTNVDGDPVWERLDLASTAFGDGAGALTYVGPCDADASPNTVTLELVSLATSAGPLPTSEYRNPCPPGSDLCQLPAECVENADTSVKFDLAIMRDADQGFFDVAVNFDDVFCSAKVDCLDAFLHDADGVRSRTMVFGFACTSGDGQPTHLYLDDVVLSCEGQPDVVVDTSGGPGNMGARPPMLFQTATYRGEEQLSGDFEKCYWNTALGVDEDALVPDCELTLSGTAAPADWDNGASPAGTIWPVVNWRLPLTNAAGTLQCGAHGLDDGDVVTTGYTGLSGRRFRHAMRCDDQTVETPGATRCTGTVSALGDVSVSQSATQVVVSSATGGDSVPYTLPGGLTVVSCCPDNCCDEGGQ